MQILFTDPTWFISFSGYGTGREKLFKDQGFYSQDLHVCSLEINEYFKILTTSFECFASNIYIYMLMQPSAKWVYSVTSLSITLLLSMCTHLFNQKRLMCKDHINGSFPTCSVKQVEMIPGRGRGYSLIWFITFCL